MFCKSAIQAVQIPEWLNQSVLSVSLGFLSQIALDRSAEMGMLVLLDKQKPRIKVA